MDSHDEVVYIYPPVEEEETAVFEAYHVRKNGSTPMTTSPGVNG
jgi:hypothetical protein